MYSIRQCVERILDHHDDQGEHSWVSGPELRQVGSFDHRIENADDGRA